MYGESEMPRVGVQARFLETLGHYPNIMEQGPSQVSLSSSSFFVA